MHLLWFKPKLHEMLIDGFYRRMCVFVCAAKTDLLYLVYLNVFSVLSAHKKALTVGFSFLLTVALEFCYMKNELFIHRLG